MGVRVACSSAAYHRALSSGSLTQLEWLDLCGSELPVDGVAFDERHFPRCDGEYLAQLKKMAVDMGLAVEALVTRFEPAAEGSLERLTASLQQAALLGAPLAIVCLGASQALGATLGQVVHALKEATGVAKRLNVTLALKNTPGTAASGAADLKTLSKQTDSAWLRYAVDVAELPQEAAEPAELRRDTVAGYHAAGSVDTFGADERNDLRAALRFFENFAGPLILAYEGEEEERTAVPRLVNWVRAMLAKDIVTKATM
ncbi:hypothetical protein EPN52_02985 [bacterium]|nr:MAG: hypothetical protein EPN52_02985 [bacterium]